MALVRFQPVPSQHLLSNFFNRLPEVAGVTQPVVNILETPAGFRLEVAAPGLSKEDFNIKLEKNLLTVSAVKQTGQAENGLKFHRREFAYGSFERVFRLPDSVDAEKVEAKFHNGILYIELQKKAELQPVTKSIEVA